MKMTVGIERMACSHTKKQTVILAEKDIPEETVSGKVLEAF